MLGLGFESAISNFLKEKVNKFYTHKCEFFNFDGTHRCDFENTIMSIVFWYTLSWNLNLQLKYAYYTH
jgi:hypothetical protein